MPTMSNPYDTPIPLTATGNVNRSTFIALDTSTAYYGKQCVNNTTISIGISGESFESPPQSGAGTYHATDGNAMGQWYGPGAVCPLVAGAGGWSIGDQLTANANGEGITTTTSGNWVGAQALEAASAGEMGFVRIVQYFLH